MQPRWAIWPVAMLSRLSRSRRPAFSAQLIRHFSIRVPSLKKQSLVAQLLRAKPSPKLTNSTQKEELSIPLLQRGDASLRSVHPHPPLGLSAELAGAENDRQEIDDAGSAYIARPSVRSRKGIQRSDVVETPSTVSQPRGGCKADACEHKTERNGFSELSEPSRVTGGKVHCNVGAPQSCVEAQAAASKRGQASDCDGRLLQTGERKVYASEVAVQSRVAGKDGHHSHIPAEITLSGKKPTSQIGEASKIFCCPPYKLDNSPLSTKCLKETSCLVTEVGDGRKLSISPESEEDEVQNAVEHNLFQLRTAVEREINKRLELQKLVELYSEMIRREVTDAFLNDWQQISTETDRFFNNLQLKIDLVITESVALKHVKALLVNREFLSASPQNLIEVLTIFKQFSESHDKSCEILAKNPILMVQRPERLQERFRVLFEFEVDTATRCRCATLVMNTSTDKLRENLSFLKDLGLSAESRNRIMCKASYIFKSSIKNHLESVENFFESIEIARPSVIKLVEQHPGIYLTSQSRALRVIYKLFQHLGLSSTDYIEALGQMKYARLDVFLHYNLFRKQGLSDETFASMIIRNPKILSVSVQSVEAKLHFLLHKVKWDISEVIAFPCYFNYSLANRIIPRFKLLEQLNLHRQPALSTVIISPKLRSLAV